MSSKIFCGGISYDTDNDALEKHFSTYGDIESCEVIRDKKTEKSKGYGFVTFKDPETAKAVVEEGKQELDGRSFEPSIAQGYKIFVGGCSDGMTEEMLMEYFVDFGKCTSASVIKDKEDKTKNRGFAFVEFEDRASRDAALEAGEHTIGEFTCKVKEAMAKDGGGFGGRGGRRGGKGSHGFGGYGSGFGGFGPPDPSMMMMGGYGGYGYGQSYGGGPMRGYGYGGGAGPYGKRGGRGKK